MNIKLSEMKRYLLKEQGYTDEQIRSMSREEIYDAYIMYHEDEED